MRRILSIAICSFWLIASGHAQWAWTNTATQIRMVKSSSGSASVVFHVTGPNSYFLARTNQYTGPGNITVALLSGGNANGEYTATVISISPTNQGTPSSIPSGVFNWSGSTLTPAPTPTPTPTPTPPSDPIETNSFVWNFPPEWAGSTVEIKTADGVSLGTWGLPAHIGPEGYQLSSSVATNASVLGGSSIFVDGQFVGALNSSGSVTSWAAYRPAYDIEFDGSFGGGEWQIRRSDGTIAMSGSIATLGSAASGRFTLTGTNTGTLWTRVPAGDGMGSAWVQSPVAFQPNNSVTSFSLVNTNQSPTPFPTPAPLTTPVSVPSSPTNSTTSPTTITNIPAADTNVVSVGVGTVTLDGLDDGETNVLTTVSDIRTLISNIVTDVRGTQENLSDAVSVVNSLRLGGVSSQCTFSFGPHVSVSLQTSGILRAGLSALIVGLGIAAAVQMIRGVVS